jgi:hypothetical protein
MSESLDVQAAVATPPPVEPLRVLVPSPLGLLGIELVGPAISRLPHAGARERKLGDAAKM